MFYLYLLTLRPVTHPYFKLDYIQQHWGGQEERVIQTHATGKHMRTRSLSNVSPLYKHTTTYPTLACIALDVLPIPATTVCVKSLFSHGKEIITDCRSRLDPVLFEQLQALRYHWKDLVDFVTENAKVIEEIELQAFEYFQAHNELVGKLNDE